MSVFNPKQTANELTAKIQNIVSVIDQNGDSLINDFVVKTGDTMTGSLYFTGNNTKIIFDNGSQQSIAYSNDKDTILMNADSIVQNMSQNNGDILKIEQNLEIVGNVIVPDNTFTMSKITNLNTSLSNITSNVSNNSASISSLRTDVDGLLSQNLNNRINSTNSNVSNVSNIVSNISSNLTTLQSNVTGLLSSVSSQGNSINSITSNVSNIQSTIITQQTAIDLASANIQNLASVNTSQSNSINSIIDDIDSLRDDISQLGTTNSITSLVSNVTTLQTGLSNAVSNISSLSSNLSNLTTTVSNLSGLQDLDIVAITNIQGYITQNNSNVGNVNTDLQSYKTSNNSNITSINGSITSIQSDIDTLQSDIMTLQLYNTTNDTNISDLEAYNTTNDTNISAINSNVGNVNSDLQAYKTSNNSNITSINGSITSIQSDIDILDTFKNTQESINTNVSSNITSLNSFKNTQLTYNTNNDTNISTLQTFKTDQEALNSNISGDLIDVNNLILTKQNIINSSNKLPIANVNLGTSSLSYIDISSSLQTQLTSLTNKDTSHDNSITSINSAVATLQAADIIHDGQISAIQSNITSINTSLGTKQNIINGTNLLSYELISTTINETLDETLMNIETEIQTKQNIINGSNKLSSANVDYSSSALRFIDISANLQGQLTNINNAISTLEGLQAGDITSFQTIQDNFDALETIVNGKQNQITSSSKLLSANVDYSASPLRFVDISSNLQAQLDSLISSGLPSINYDSANTITTISDITKVDELKFTDNTIQTTAFTNTLNTSLSGAISNIASLDTRVTTVEGNITSINGTLATKQDAITGSNKLPIANVNLGTSALSFVDISSNLQAQLNAFDSSITALQTSDTGQTTSITTLTNSINDLTTSKQDLISGTNRISSEYVTYLTGNVKGTLDTINTTLSSKLDSSALSSYAPLNAPTFTGTVSGITKAMVGLGNCDNTSDLNKPVSTATQNALDLKADSSSLSSYAPLNAPTFTGTVSGVTKSMVGLGNCDNTSDANKPISSNTQTALDLKSNIAGPIFTNFIQTPRIFEVIQTTYTSFSSNILTYDYTNGSILYFSGLTSGTNFQLILNNVNSNAETNRSFTFSIIIETGTYKAFANTFKIGSTSYTLTANGGLANVSINTNATSVLQTFNIIYTSSSTTPTRVFTNLASYF